MRVPFIVYMLILNPSHHSCQHANHTLWRATSSSIRTKNTSLADFFTTKCYGDTLYSQQSVTFVKEFNDGDVAQIFMDTLEKNIKEMYNKFKFDLEYPEQLHDLHNDYPLAPECSKFWNVEKLIPNLNNKTNYVMHYENLKLYESLCLKITQIRRGIKFEESACLEEYINLNTKLRIEAKQSANNF